MYIYICRCVAADESTVAIPPKLASGFIPDIRLHDYVHRPRRQRIRIELLCYRRRRFSAPRYIDPAVAPERHIGLQSLHRYITVCD